MDYPQFSDPDEIRLNTEMLVPPASSEANIELEKGPNIKPLPPFDPLPETLEGLVLLKVGNDISTDEIMPAGAQVLPLRSNIPEISKYCFRQIDENYHERAMNCRDQGSFIVAGDNYGQGSSREHAALAPRHLGLKAVIAKGFARIHWQNLVNFGILPLTFADNADFEKIDQNDTLCISRIREMLQQDSVVTVFNKTKDITFQARHSLSNRQIEMILAGSLINLVSTTA